MLRILTFLLMLIATCATAQQPDSSGTEVKNAILSDQPVIFDRTSIKSELDALEQPVIPAGKVSIEKDHIQTRFADHEARKLFIPEVELKDAERHWIKILRRQGEGKIRTEGNRKSVSGLLVNEISAEPYDAELQWEQSSDGVNLWMALERDSIALNSSENPAIFQGMENFMILEGRTLYQEHISEEIKREVKKLQDLQNDYDRMVRDNERFHKRITDNNIRIEDSNRELDNLEEQAQYASERENSIKDDLLRSRDKQEQKSLKKAMREAERESDKIEKQRNKLYDKLVEYRKEIEEHELLITENLNSQKDLIIAIRKQELRIEAYREKLQNVE